MPKLMILCIDGLLEPEHPITKSIKTMPYERRLTIPKELFWEGIPHTLNIWSSIFSGQIIQYPIPYKKRGKLRLFIRRQLVKHGITWTRRGWKIRSAGYFPVKHKKLVVLKMKERSVFDDYNSFTWNIPAVSPSFIFTGMEELIKHNYEVWKVLVQTLSRYNYDVIGIYTNILDLAGHHEYSLKDVTNYYKEIFSIAQKLPCNVMIVSDHGCIDKEHTHSAYFGCDKPIFANNILEVRKDIEAILNEHHIKK